MLNNGESHAKLVDLTPNLFYVPSLHCILTLHEIPIKSDCQVLNEKTHD